MLKKFLYTISLVCICTGSFLQAARLPLVTPRIEQDPHTNKTFFSLPNPNRMFHTITGRGILVFDSIRIFITDTSRPLTAQQKPSSFTWKEHFSRPSNCSDGLFYLTICQEKGKPYRVYLNEDGRLPGDVSVITVPITNPFFPPVSYASPLMAPPGMPPSFYPSMLLPPPLYYLMPTMLPAPFPPLQLPPFVTCSGMLSHSPAMDPAIHKAEIKNYKTSLARLTKKSPLSPADLTKMQSIIGRLQVLRTSPPLNVPSGQFSDPTLPVLASTPGTPKTVSFSDNSPTPLLKNTPNDPVLHPQVTDPVPALSTPHTASTTQLTPYAAEQSSQKTFEPFFLNASSDTISSQKSIFTVHSLVQPHQSSEAVKSVRPSEPISANQDATSQSLQALLDALVIKTRSTPTEPTAPIKETVVHSASSLDNTPSQEAKFTANPSAKQLRKQAAAEAEAKRKQEIAQKNQELEARKIKQREDAKQRLLKQEEEEKTKKRLKEEERQKENAQALAKKAKAAQKALQKRLEEEKCIQYAQARVQAQETFTHLFEAENYDEAFKVAQDPLLEGNFGVLARTKVLQKLITIKDDLSLFTASLDQLRPNLESLAKNLDSSDADRATAWIALIDLYPQNFDTYYSSNQRLSTPHVDIVYVLAYLHISKHRSQDRNIDHEGIKRKLAKSIKKHGEEKLKQFYHWYLIQSFLEQDTEKALALCQEGLERHPHVADFRTIKKELTERQKAETEQSAINPQVISLCVPHVKSKKGSPAWFDEHGFHFLSMAQQMSSTNTDNTDLLNGIFKQAFIFLQSGDTQSVKNMIARIIIHYHQPYYAVDEVVALGQQILRIADPDKNCSKKELSLCYFYIGDILCKNYCLHEALPWITLANDLSKGSYQHTMNTITQDIHDNKTKIAVPQAFPEPQTPQEYAQRAHQIICGKHLLEIDELLSIGNCLQKSDLSNSDNIKSLIHTEYLLAAHHERTRLPLEQLESFVGIYHAPATAINTQILDEFLYLLAYTYGQLHRYTKALETLSGCSPEMKKQVHFVEFSTHVAYLKEHCPDADSKKKNFDNTPHQTAADTTQIEQTAQLTATDIAFVTSLASSSS